MSSAENQQERLKTFGWIVGFTDGEGCFSITITKNKTMRYGWQVQPEFVVTQSQGSLSALEALKSFFGCGNIFVNRRYDNHNENLYRYCVRSFRDLTKIIIPFFKENQLRTAKRLSFEKFTKVIDLMSQREHLSQEGLIKIAQVVQKLNRIKTLKFLESSETIRRSP